MADPVKHKQATSELTQATIEHLRHSFFFLAVGALGVLALALKGSAMPWMACIGCFGLTLFCLGLGLHYRFTANYSIQTHHLLSKTNYRFSSIGFKLFLTSIITLSLTFVSYFGVWPWIAGPNMSFALLAITIFLAVLALGFFSAPQPQNACANANHSLLRTLIDRITLGAYDTLPGFAPHHVYPAMHRQSGSPDDTNENDEKEPKWTPKAEAWLKKQKDDIKEKFEELRGIMSLQPITGQFYLLTPTAEENKHPVRLSALRTWLRTSPTNPITRAPMTLNAITEIACQAHQVEHKDAYQSFEKLRDQLLEKSGCLNANAYS